MSDLIRQKHRHVSLNGRIQWQRFEALRRIPSPQNQIEIQFRQKHGITEVVASRQIRKQLSQHTDSLMSQPNDRRFQEERSAFRSALICQSPQTKLVEELLQETFQIINIKPGIAVGACPEG